MNKSHKSLICCQQKTSLNSYKSPEIENVMKLLVTGGRNFNDEEFVFKELDKLHKIYNFSLLIHGDATGADTLSKNWALKNNVPVKAFPVTKQDWQQYGKAAGVIRNSVMLKENPDLLVAFPGGKGTADMVKKAQKINLEIINLI